MKSNYNSKMQNVASAQKISILKYLSVLLMPFLFVFQCTSSAICNKKQENSKPYSIIDNSDSTVYKFSDKKDEAIVKPCNLRDAHDKLDAIFKNANENISEETEMIKYHHGLGMWIRNNWGLWSRKTKLTPIFVNANIGHPDDMSGFILDTYKERTILRRNHPDSLDSFYARLGDIECKK